MRINMIQVLAVLVVLCSAVMSNTVHAKSSSCPNLTIEQTNLLQLAYNTGKPHDYGYTLAGISMQESFVGKYVVRLNPKDGKHGSYGLTHILLDTGMWLEGVTSTWEAKQDMVIHLLIDDKYALEMAIKKLNTYKGSSWMGRWNSYNGNSTTYGPKIKKHIQTIRKCGFIIE